MKIKELENKISEVFLDPEYKTEKEFTTRDNSRVDLAVLKRDDPFIAVEFEESYKWMRSRVLYDAVKADRENFQHVAVIYPFKQRGLKNCWIFDFIADELDLNAKIVHPDDIPKIKKIFSVD